jgi:hypothetical protein
MPRLKFRTNYPPKMEEWHPQKSLLSVDCLPMNIIHAQIQVAIEYSLLQKLNTPFPSSPVRQVVFSGKSSAVRDEVDYEKMSLEAVSLF